MPKAKRTVSSRATGSSARAEARDERLLQAVLAWRAGRLDDAERIGVQVLEIAPRHPPALHLLGIVASKRGRAQLAIARLAEAVSLDPANVDARNELATLLRGRGEFARAVEQSVKALEHRPDDAVALNNLGLAYFDQRDLARAIDAFERGIAHHPDIAALHVNLGVALQAQGRIGEAEAAYRRAIALAPQTAEPHARLGHLLRLQGNDSAAQTSFAQALALPGDAAARMQLARLLYEAGELDSAERCLRDLIAVDTRSAIAHDQLGRLLQQRGRFDDAIASFARALELDPNNTSAYAAIVASRKVRADDAALVETMSARLLDPAIADDDRANLHYALGKARDDLGDYALAMRDYDAANAIAAQNLRRSGRMLDRAAHAAIVDRLIATYTPEFFARHAQYGAGDETPVLIVGMIRSGTSLVEQILSSHRNIGAGGELRFLGDHAQAVADTASGKLDRPAAARIREDYLQLLHGTAPGKRCVTDKMPTNFLLLGLVALLLPRARIVHCRRHPVDTCLSIYFTPFSRSPDYAHDRDNLVFYYRQYLRLMAHWRRVLPADRFFDLDYESLTVDRERITRALVAFCGLDWDDACLHHESNPRVIRTPSVWQARQPVYRTSVERWRRYEPWLREFGELLDAPK